MYVSFTYPEAGPETVPFQREFICCPNAELPILVTLFGIVTEVSLLLINACSPILTTLLPIVTEVS